ncbi:TetR/AcrR family transcriptional regulator [uncultured Pseudodesulfovibrio sp.]|uniref:TetR/AcrR family transcriptional regulator n=1 Tax=uncultured Pseudodesulfovibrio sp. TaxID=2035858 RepID=UPI0029C7958A|nr:TetR/AcrR family transcriptional regulator [uncultured Pseudodesulfovibrio sp.]
MARKVDKEGAEKRRKQILKAAGKCFSKTGFHQTSMADICKRANLSPGTVYHYFRSKDEIIFHFAQRELDEAQAFAEALSQVESIEELVRLTVDEVLKAEEFEELQFYLEVLSEGGRNRKVGKVLRKADEVAYLAIHRQLKRLKAKGSGSTYKALTLFVMTQIGALEMFKLEEPSAKECREMSRLSRKALLHILTEK